MSYAFLSLEMRACAISVELLRLKSGWAARIRASTGAS